MRKTATIAALGALLLAPVVASAQDGDAAEGESAFRQCQTCHVVENDEGEVLAGRNAKTGPNLYGLPGRAAASVEDFRYGDGIKEAGEKGLVWNEEEFVKYVQDPTAYLREYTGDDSARSKMSYKARSEEDAHNLWAFISSLSPES
jgi:cytochrome c